MADPTTTPTTPTTATPHGTRASQTEEAILADAEHVIGIARSQLAAFAAADAGRTVQRVSGDTLDRMEAAVTAVRAARGAQPVKRTGLLANTTAEIQARSTLLGLLTDARMRVETVHRGNKDLQTTFGLGAKWGVQRTGPLLSGAAQIVAAVDDPTVASLAAAAGVGPTQIGQIQSARDAVVEADRAQNIARSTRANATSTKNELLTELKSDVAYVRKVARNVFAKSPKTLALFGSVVARYTPTPRKAPPAGTVPKKRRGSSPTAKRLKQALATTTTAPTAAPAATAKKGAVKKAAVKKSAIVKKGSAKKGAAKKKAKR